MSIVRGYASLTELFADSALVVQAVPTGAVQHVPADQDGRGPVPASVTTVRVEQVLAGTAAAEIAVRQVVGGVCPREVPLRVAASYVLFLTFADRVPTGEYVIVGTQGAYEVVGDVLQLASANAGDLPATVLRAELDALVRS